MSEATHPDLSMLLRRIPAVEEVLSTPQIRGLLAAHPRWVVLEAVREVLADRRRRLLQGGLPPEPAERLLAPSALAAAVAEVTAQRAGSSLAPVLNATGVVLHTNLGRAPLAPSALQALEAAGRGYCNLEFDLGGGGTRLP